MTLYTTKNFLEYRSKDIINSISNTSQVVFEVTDMCNLKCKYCVYGEFYEDFDNRQNSKLDIDKAIQLLLYLNNL